MRTTMLLSLALATLLNAPAFAAITVCTDLRAGAEALLAAHGAVLPEYGTQALATLDVSTLDEAQRDAALLATAKLGQVAWTAQLLAAGARVDWRDPQAEFSLTPLIAAAWCGHSAVVEQLLSAGAATHVCGELPFAGMDRIAVCPLHAALAGPEFEGGQPEIVAALRAHGADPAQPDGHGDPASAYLHMAEPERRPELAAALGLPP